LKFNFKFLPTVPVQFNTAVSVGGRWQLTAELGCDLLSEADQRASHNIVLNDVDERVENDVAE